MKADRPPAEVGMEVSVKQDHSCAWRRCRAVAQGIQHAMEKGPTAVHHLSDPVKKAKEGLKLLK